MLEYQNLLYFAVFMGALLLVATFYMVSRGIVGSGSKMHRRLQFLGLMLLVLPAAADWYFSNSLIVLVAILMCGYGVFKWLKQSGGK